MATRIRLIKDVLMHQMEFIQEGKIPDWTEVAPCVPGYERAISAEAWQWMDIEGTGHYYLVWKEPAYRPVETAPVKTAPIKPPVETVPAQQPRRRKAGTHGKKNGS